MKALRIFLAVMILGTFFVSVAFAQDGSAPEAGTAAPASSSAAEPAPASTTAPAPRPAVVVPPPPLPPPSPSALPSTTLPPGTPPNLGGEGDDNSSLWPILVGVFAAGLGTAILWRMNQKRKAKEKSNDKKCLNWKKLMEEKLNELTEIKSRLGDFAKNKTLEELKKETQGTPAGELLAHAERVEKEYKRLKELYEKCITDLENRGNVFITYFVHGTSVDNEKEISSGWSDVELSELGVRQSVDLKEKVKGKHFDIVFCSDLKRAVHSARLAFGGIAPIIPDARLRERNYGKYNAQPSSVVEPMKEKAITERFPDGESYEDVKNRVTDFLDYLKKNYEGKSVAIVAHEAPQLALDVLLKGKSWEEAISQNWRKTKPWQPGWEYELK